MKINSLRLTGFTGIHKGMNLSELELDLSGLSGLIALSGKNGSGKTTVLESLQPYRTLASRKRSLAAHVYTRNAAKELSFDFQGDRYETKVLIDAESGKQEGYVWKNGDSMVDGKVRNYDAYIRDLFGSEDLFFNSIFCAQNAQKLSDLTTGKLKELFAEFLRLNQYIAYEATTKQCITLLSSNRAAFTSHAAHIQDQVAAYGDLPGKLAQAQANLDQSNASHAKTMEELATLDAEIAKVKEAMAANDAIEARAADYKGRITDMENQIAKARADYEKEAGGLRNQVLECTRQINAQAQLLSMQDIIEQAVERKAEIEEEITAKEPGVTAGYAKRETIRKRLDEINAEIQTRKAPHPHEKELSMLANRMSTLQAQTADLERRDPDCTSTICGFINTALHAEQVLPELRAERDQMLEAVTLYEAEQAEKIAILEAEKAELQAADKSYCGCIEQLQTRLSEIKKKHAEISHDARLLGDLREALARQEAAENQKADLIRQGMRLKDTLDDRIAAMEADLTAAKASYHEIMGQIILGVKDRLSGLTVDRAAAAKAETAWMERISDFTANVRIIQDQIAEKAVLEKQLAELDGKAQTITTQVSEWTYLRNALSKDGIRALEIDSVAPSISAYANQILFNTFGPAYSVKLRTQDDEGKEVLDILALQDDGSETLLEDLSGGQQVWCLKALRLALTLIAKQKSGKQLLSAFSDEEDGALDAGNAQNFIHMYRAFMDAGGFDTCYFISHRPECVAMANSVLSFDDGGITVN